MVLELLGGSKCGAGENGKNEVMENSLGVLPLGPCHATQKGGVAEREGLGGERGTWGVGSHTNIQLGLLLAINPSIFNSPISKRLLVTSLLTSLPNRPTLDSKWLSRTLLLSSSSFAVTVVP